MSKFLFSVLVLWPFSIASVIAENAILPDVRGHVVKLEGHVQIVNEKGVKKKVDEPGLVIREKDTIVTRSDGKAVVRFTDGALTVLDRQSRLRVEKTGWLSHLGGKIYFTFRKVLGEPKKVETPFATIGIRGTTFIIYDNEQSKSIALQEGQLEIESPGEAFEIHKQSTVDDFEAFKQKARERQSALKSEYEGYKKRTMDEFVEYKKSFMLEPDKMVSFDGTRVKETEINDTVEQDFSDFENLAEEMLFEFRRQTIETDSEIKN